jgi:hypothetical protein
MRQIKIEEYQDRKAQERKRQLQQQAQLSQLSGTQNLIDLLTLLLQPAFKMNQTNFSQRRSHSQRPMGYQQGALPSMGMPQQNMAPQPA